MAGYEQVDEFEEIPEDKEGVLLSHRPAEGMPEDPDDRLNFTQSVRAMVINEVIKDGQIPVNNKDLMGILKDALDGIDRQELGKKKVEVKKNDASNVAAVAKLLEQMSIQISRDTNGQGYIPVVESQRKARDPALFERDLTKEFGNIDDSELALVRKEETSEDFFKRMEDRDPDN